MAGPINLTSPNPVTMQVFARELGKKLGRPPWLRIPAFILRIVLGEMSSVVLDGQRTMPEKLISAGFVFKYPTIKSAFAEIFT